MCGRYALYGPVKRGRTQARWFDDLASVMRLVDGKPAVAPLRWGLIPHWAKDAAIGNRLINARADTLAQKPAFRDAYRARRCLVPASGFYEWKRAPGGKQPWYVTSADGTLLAFAGLWERWQLPGSDPVLSFTIITTDAAGPVKEIHDRMPAILEPEDFDAWLKDENPGGLLRPCRPEILTAYPVNAAINSPRNDGPSLVEPLAPR